MLMLACRCTCVICAQNLPWDALNMECTLLKNCIIMAAHIIAVIYIKCTQQAVSSRLYNINNAALVFIFLRHFLRFGLVFCNILNNFN